jgi:predicted dinucleotide-utilizing enzyme
MCRILQETVEMAQNVERLKIEFLKQMQSEEERMQEEVQALQKKYQTEHNQFQERSESVLRSAQQQFEKANNVSAASSHALAAAHTLLMDAGTIRKEWGREVLGMSDCLGHVMCMLSGRIGCMEPQPLCCSVLRLLKFEMWAGHDRAHQRSRVQTGYTRIAPRGP